MVHSTLPNFIIIGAPKCGTTSLFYYLRQHPDIYLPIRKELHYFSHKLLGEHASGPGDLDIISSLCVSKSEYVQHYLDVTTEKVVGEVSPSYLYYSEVAERIHEELGPVKIIVVIRDPVDKAYSQYMHMVRDQRESLGFYEALQAEGVREKSGWSDIWLYSKSSLYSNNIRKYQDVFGKENVKIVLFDELEFCPDSVMESLFSYLGVNPAYKCDTTTIYNRSGVARNKFIARFFSNPNLIKSFLKMVVPEQIRIRLRLKLMDWNTMQKEYMSKECYFYLRHYFEEDLANLAKIISRELPWGKREFRR